MSDFIRLRQICLAVPNLAESERRLCALFGVQPCHRDERVHKYGLRNVVLALGPTFIELVEPQQPETAAARFIERNPPLRGAYMAIFDCSDLAAWRGRALKLGLRIINERRYERYANFQLHPRDTGATMVEIHQNQGGENLYGHYEPGGDDWPASVRQERTLGISGARIFSPDPAAIGRRWSALLGRPLERGDDGGSRLALDFGELCFQHSAEDAERLLEVDVAVRAPAAQIAAAAQLGYATQDDCVIAEGLRWRLHTTSYPAMTAATS